MRIIASRLVMWNKVSPEQTAFQKGKSTIDQIFLLHIIINLAKLCNVTLYIGYFDLTKACLTTAPFENTDKIGCRCIIVLHYQSYILRYKMRISIR